MYRSTDGASATTLQALPSALLRANDLGDVVRLTKLHVQAALGDEHVAIYLRDGSRLVRHDLAAVPPADASDQARPSESLIGEGFVGRAARAKRPLQLAGAKHLGADADGSAGSCSALAVPILFDDEVLGVIDSHHSDRRTYSQDEIVAVRAIAAIAATRIRSLTTTTELERTVSELREAQHMLQASAETDALTGIGNRRRFERCLAETRDAAAPFHLCAFDLDLFKSLNDLHGHHVGDRVLRDVAAILTRHFAPVGATVARVGGDEFAALASAPLDQVRALAEAIVDEVPDAFSRGDVQIALTVSVGLADGTDPRVWNNADDALYVAKKAGGAQVRVFDPSDPDLIAIQTARAWSGRIRHAIGNDELALVAQAIVPAAPPVIGEPAPMYEVLLRDSASTGDGQSFSEFVEAAARLGLESEIDRWVLDHVLDALAHSDPNISMCMNWSPSSIEQDCMTDLVLERISALDVDPQRLIIEVTERACIQSPDRFARSVQAIRAAGVRVAIDNLGSGWTSLATLRDNPVDFIKIEGSWVRAACSDEMARVAVKSMIDCASMLGATVVAESIEDEATRTLMVELGAHLLQGWLLHRAVPLDTVVD